MTTRASARGPGTDWARLHARLEAARAALARATEPDAAAAARILEARARALARTPSSPATQEMLQVVEFALSTERYAVETAYVREVQPLRQLTSMPGAPPHVRGVVNVRGRIIALLDLGRLFELPERGLGELNRIVVLASGAMEFALLADAIAGVASVATAVLSPSLPTLAGVRERYLRGVSAERLIVLDAARLLDDGGVPKQN